MVEGNSCDSTEDQLEADVTTARLTPAGVYVSAPLQEAEGGGGRQEHRGWGGRRLFIPGMFEKYSRAVSEQKNSPALEKDIGLEEAPPIDDVDPNFKSPPLLPPGTSQVFPLSVLLMLLFKRPCMMDDF